MNNKIKLTFDRIIFNVFSYTYLIFFALVCLLPFILVLSSSFTSEKYITEHGFTLLPLSFSLDAYKTAFEAPEVILRAYGVTVLVTIVGTLTAVFLMSMTAYVISRRDCKWANGFAFYLFFTTLFSGGLVPWYIMLSQYLHMKNNLAVLVLPYLFSVFYILLLKTFMRGIPEALAESARIDGANDFTIFARIMLPISKPAIATVTLFTALAYWNDWYLCMLFISDSELSNLQFFLYNMLSNAEALRALAQSNSNVVIDTTKIIPSESMKMAMTVIVTGPIILLYPFLQKYFIKGLTVGAVKG